MQFVLLLIFQIISGLVLLPIVIHYVYYIINAIAGDLCEQKRAQREQQLQRSPTPRHQNRHPPHPPPTEEEPVLSINNLTNSSRSPTAAATTTAMQTNDDAKFIKKRWKGGSIEPHPTDKALIVNYQLEATVFGEPNNPMIEEKKHCQKIIRLRSLNAKTDPAALAREVVEKCDLIHKSQLNDVEQIIFYLKNRKDNASNDIPDNNTHSRRSAALHTSHTRSSARSHSSVAAMTSSTGSGGGSTGASNGVSNALSAATPTADVSINNIDEYVELLYEELGERIRGSAMILQMARNPDNLEELEKNEACLSALSRVLREDWRKSLDLSTNIIYIFFCFSTYTKFHPLIVQYKIGSLCMDVIDYELRRYETMRNELDVRKQPNGSSTPHSAKASKEKLNRSTDDFLDIMNEEKPKEMEPPRRRIPELKQRPKSGNWSSFHGSMSSSLIKSQILNSSYHESLCAGGSPGGDTPAVPAEQKAQSNESLDRNDPKVKKEEIDRLNKQLKIFAKKQEQLLRVAFYLLLNMAENVKLEEKMRRKHIVKMLVKALDRQNIDLLMLVSTFLKKLSIVGDNKDEMGALNIVAKLPRLFQSTHTDLVQVTLKLVFNLSFDGGLRRKMIAAGYLPMLVMFINDEKHHGIAVKILYHMSLDDKVKGMFTQTECVQMATDAIILNLNVKVDLDLIALCINLSLNRRNAQIMVEGQRLHSLMDRAFKYQDALLMKLLRNLSQHESLQLQFIDYVGDLARILTICDDEAFIVECLGILGNLALTDLDYSQILQNFQLIPWIRQILLPCARMDDLVLDTIVYLGTCACDELCALLFCRAKVVISLIELLKAKQEDDEIVLQIIFVFQQILRHESTREYMIKETESAAYLIDLMHDKNEEIRKVCDYCLDIIAISDSEWAKRIKLEKFRNHNSQWLCMVESQQDQDNEQDYADQEDECDNDLDTYLRSEYLDNCDLYNDNADNDSNSNSNHSNNNPASPAMSTYSRPLSTYRRSQDLDDLYNMTSSSKSQGSSDNNYIFKSNKSLDADGLHEELLMA
uniref:Kinesin associated protein 3, isoform G n=2 Tax=Drosophila melanogaster TaxID=7227 RepID=Q9VZ07_DROME|nr:kinesin associated protein 3, isoform G [Drosophila melanogaster]AAF48025.4 kinesin associated protein 3, isoform G [Drosophila melanogaster]AAQ22539.1 LD13052p [Drosophila melanogaster]|eukprot:NP_727512.3 kinesin associated protein 3, isoform G [Drosophila melanogaster]